LILVLIISGCFLLSNYVQAKGLEDPLGERDIPTLVGNIISYILSLVGVLALVMFIYGGLTWMISGGNEEKIKKAAATIKAAIIGLILSLSAWMIWNFIFEKLILG